MNETKRLYYTDSYRTKITTRISSASDDGLRIVLEETNFYPTSGGQPHDVGTLNGIAVIDVVDEPGGIAHILAAPMSLALNNAEVEGEIGWHRRYDHMQQHTGQHLLSAVFEDLWGLPTLSFHMGDQSSAIELGTKALTVEQTAAVTLRATELARANASLAVTFEDAAQAHGLRKASEREGMLRIVEIPGIDRSACGGTHVANLAEVLPLQLREVEKVRGNVRISFVCGNRAIERSQLDFRSLARIAAALGTSQERAEEQTVALKKNLAETEKHRQRLETEAAVRAGLDLYAGTATDENGVRRLLLAEPVIDDNARQKAKAFSSRPAAVLLMQSAEGLLLACSPDSGLNAGEILKQALAKYGARGGGTATLAQGSVPDQEMVRDLIQTLRLNATPGTSKAGDRKEG